jgi:anti-sigma B factor antagonist
MPDLTPTTDAIAAARQEGDALVITIKGEIDLHVSPDLRTDLFSMLQKTGAKRLIFDLVAVPYMDSSAIAVLVEALQKLRKSGGKVLLTGLQPRVKGLLEIARLNSIFTVCASVDEAIKK